MKQPLSGQLVPLLIAALLCSTASLSHAAAVSLATGNYPPYTLETPDGDRPGFDHEVALAAMAAAGHDATITYMPWKRAFKVLEVGRMDGVVTCSDVPERNRYLILSDPISSSGMAVVTHRDFPGEPINAVGQLRKLDSLVAIRGFATQQELSRLNIPHEQSSSVLNSLRMVARKRVSGFFIGLENSQYVAANDGISNQLRFHRMTDRPSNPFHLCFSRKIDNAERLRDDFNRGLRLIRESGEYQRIHDRYR